MKASSPDSADLVGAMPASPYSRANVRKGIVHYLLGRGMSALAGFATVILLVRGMEVAAYAGYAALLGLTTVIGMIAGLGMERALARFIPEGHLHHSPRQLGYFIWLTSLLRLAVMAGVIAALVLLWPSLAARFAGFGAEFPPGLLLLILGTTMFQLLSAVMQALVQQKTLTRVLVVQWGGRLALILLLIGMHDAILLEQAIWLMAIPDTVGALILAVLIRRYLAGLALERPRPPRREAPWPPWRQVRRLSLDNYGYNLLAALPQGSAMIVLAAAVLAAPFVAAYGFFINLIERLKQYLPLQFMLNLAEPVLIAGYVHDRDFDRLCHHNRLLYKFNLIFLAPALAWIAAIAPQLTALMTGGKYADQSWILVVLLLQLALGSHATILQIIINAVGKSAILARSGAAALLAMGAAIALAIGAGAPVYVAAAPLVYEAVNNLVAIAGLRRQGFHYRPQWKFHCKLLAAAGAGYGCALGAAGIFTSAMLQILAAGLAALLVFAVITVLLRVFDSGDVHSLKLLLKREESA